MQNLTHEHSHEPLVNYLRVHRRKAGLSQSEVGRILGYGNQTSAVSHHELFESIPPFLMALGYEILFKEPAGKLFPGLKLTLEAGIEQRIAELERELRSKINTDPHSDVIARKLEWLEERATSG
jgi:hypothetical protein